MVSPFAALTSEPLPSSSAALTSEPLPPSSAEPPLASDHEKLFHSNQSAYSFKSLSSCCMSTRMENHMGSYGKLYILHPSSGFQTRWNTAEQKPCERYVTLFGQVYTLVVMDIQILPYRENTT